MQRLETARLVLRDFSYDDLDDFYEYAKSPKVGPMAGWKPHESKDESYGIIASFRKKQEVWAIYHKEDKKVIGSVGVHRKSIESVFELGYVLSEDYWGQGVVVEACEEILKHCFNTLGFKEIFVEHFLSNIQSKRVIEKLGFEFETLVKECYTMYDGVTQDCLKYRLTKERYNAKA